MKATPLLSKRQIIDTPARCAEYLRLAVQAMTRQPACPDPVTYAVWYAHVSGRHAALSAELTRLDAAGMAIDDERVRRLFDDHLRSADERVGLEVAEDLRRMLDRVDASAEATAMGAHHFGDALARWRDLVHRGEATDTAHLASMQRDTLAVRSAVGALQQELTHARAEADRLRADLERARDEAQVDVLTGLPNRRGVQAWLDRCAPDSPLPPCLLLTDIDHFKRVNDSFGHLFGDQVLRAVAQGLRACLGTGQWAARVGGEEFVVLLPASSSAQALGMAERIRSTVAGSRIRRRDGGTVGQITVSLGVAARRAGETFEAWFERADAALYAAKHAGRNQVMLAS
jgi:diguanylate cyclase